MDVYLWLRRYTIVMLGTKKKSRDPHIKAQEELNTELNELAPLITTQEKRKTTSESSHNNQRLLIITTDASIHERGSLAYRRMHDLDSQFREIHVLLLRVNKKPHFETVVHPLDSVWIYTIETTYYWQLFKAASAQIHSHVVFAGDFRADVIVAEDLCLAGLMAWWLGRTYKRPVQYHIYDNFWDTSVIQTQTPTFVCRNAAAFLLSRATSVRVHSETQRQAILHYTPRLKDSVDLLPGYYDLEAWEKQEPCIDLRATYPQFKFILVHVSSMRQASHTDTVLAGVAPILRQYPTVGLVILGNGPMRSKIEHIAISFGVQNQVEFVPTPHDIVSYLKTAHLLVQLSDNDEDDEALMIAAAVRLPIIANVCTLAGTLFKNLESARLCETGDSSCITKAITTYLNENESRVRLPMNAHDIVFDRVRQDYASYLKAYKESIIACTHTKES